MMQHQPNNALLTWH